MKDFLGQELFVGDNIVMIDPMYGGGVYFKQAKITKINKIMLSTTEGNKSPEKVVKIDKILNNLDGNR